MAKNGRKGTPTVPDRSLIAGVDGADPGHAALMWTAAEASRRGLTLHIVNVEESLAARLPLGAALSEVTEVIEAGSTAILKHATESVADKYPELELTTAQPEGDPARWLIKASKSAALLVLGTHGKHKLTHAAVGTTAFKTASHAKCPVVLVHPDRKHEHASPARVVVGIDFSTAAQDALDFASTAAGPGGTVRIVHAWWFTATEGAIVGSGDTEAERTILQRHEHELDEIAEQAR